MLCALRDELVAQVDALKETATPEQRETLTTKTQAFIAYVDEALSAAKASPPAGAASSVRPGP